MAGPALADAVAALVLGDLLEPEDAEVLYGAWFNLIGAPPLPEPAQEEEPKAIAKSRGQAGPGRQTQDHGQEPGQDRAPSQAAAKSPAKAKGPAKK